MTEVSNCIPDLCSNAGLSDNEFCSVVKDSNIQLNQLYLGGYIALKEVPTLTNGLEDLYKNDVGSWLITISLSTLLPFVVMIMAIVFVLVDKKIISYSIAFAMIILLITVTLISLLSIMSVTYRKSAHLTYQTHAIIKSNWETNKDRIMYDIASAYLSPDDVVCRQTNKNTDISDQYYFANKSHQ